MRRPYHFTARLLATLLSLFVLNTFAQDAATENKTVEAKTAETEVTETQAAETKKSDAKPAAQSAKKMVQDATINLQTTITGNQEQPRVLYILPWQSPQTADIDFEPLDNQQKAVFGHVEREELRRELESSGELE